MALQDYATGSLLLALAFGNLYMSFSQEFAAEQTLAALKNLSSPEAVVLRDGREQTIPSRDIVPGDILLVQEGDSVAADARLIYVSNLETDEALLTGESLPVQKQLIVLEKEGTCRSYITYGCVVIIHVNRKKKKEKKNYCVTNAY